MKQISKVLMVMLLLSTAFSGCKKDDDDDDNGKMTSYFKVDGNTYELGSGFLAAYGEGDWHEGYNLDLHLYSPGLMLDPDSYDLMEGKGQAMIFELFSEVRGSLAEGEYEYVAFDDDEIMPTWSFDWAAYAIGIDMELEEVELEREIVDGKLTVQKEGTKYIIDMDCTDDEGNKLIGRYEGTLLFLDASDFGMAAQASSFSVKRSIVR